MLRLKVARKIATSPGSLIHIGDRIAEEPRIRLIEYGPQRVEEREFKTVSDCLAARQAVGVSWINLDGLHEVGFVEQLGQAFGLHALTLEDILHTGQRPKIEEFDDYIFIVLRVLGYKEELEDEQISLILGKGFVLSFQERHGDVFEPVRERIRHGKGRIRNRQSDYLAYALVDAIVDNYFLVLERLGEQIEALSDNLVEDPRQSLIEQIHDVRTQMLGLRRSVWPLREVLSRLARMESKLFEDDTEIFIRDVYDHTIQVIDVIETYREMSSGLIDLYLSSASNKMNEVMKVLTVMASIFIPLTFIAGIYGMNFEYMPELHVEWGYFFALFLMALVGVGMLFYFKRKKWL